MPLAFESLSHATIAFGFFQIESHMLLLDRLFFFADDFCVAVEELASNDNSAGGDARIAGWRIGEAADAGDLHGAIAGRDHSGFIGATYRRWPFPSEPSRFRQNPDGHKTRAAVHNLIAPFGSAIDLKLRWTPHAARGSVSVGDYEFDGPEFRRLIDYVARGGHPRWTDDRQPDYVQRMLARVANVW